MRIAGGLTDMLQVQSHLARVCAENEIKASDVLVREALTAPFTTTDVAHIGKCTESSKEMREIPRSRDTFPAVSAATPVRILRTKRKPVPGRPETGSKLVANY